MGGTKVLRNALAGGALAAALGVSVAAAQDAAAPTDQIDFTDPQTALTEGAALNLSVTDDSPQRYSPLDQHAETSADERRVQLELAAGGRDSPLDVSLSQRASIGADRNGDVDRRGRGSELRVGSGLVAERDGERRGSSTYVFVASDNEALTWQPGSRNEFGGRGPSLSLQDQVEVGDLAAGVTWERNGVQTSLAYVEREESTRVGTQSFTQDQSFTGVTVTMRR